MVAGSNSGLESQAINLPAEMRNARQEQIDVCPSVLQQVNLALPTSLSLWQMSTAPKFEAYLSSGGKFHVTPGGDIKPFRMEPTGKGNGKAIAENAKIRKTNISPAQAAQLVYGIVSAIVVAEHLATIDKKLDHISSVLDEIKSSIEDDILSSIRVAGASIVRFQPDGVDGVGTDVAIDWLNNLRKSRERIVPMIDRIIVGVKITDSFLQSSQFKDISTELEKLNHGIALVEALMVCDALIQRISKSTGAVWAEDGIDFVEPKHLARKIGKSITSLVKAAHSDMKYDRSFRSKVYEKVAPTRERLSAIVNMIDRNEEMKALRSLLELEPITATISDGQIVSLNRLICSDDLQIETPSSFAGIRQFISRIWKGD